MGWRGVGRGKGGAREGERESGKVRGEVIRSANGLVAFLGGTVWWVLGGDGVGYGGGDGW